MSVRKHHLKGRSIRLLGIKKTSPSFEQFSPYPLSLILLIYGCCSIFPIFRYPIWPLGSFYLGLFISALGHLPRDAFSNFLGIFLQAFSYDDNKWRWIKRFFFEPTKWYRKIYSVVIQIWANWSTHGWRSQSWILPVNKTQIWYFFNHVFDIIYLPWNLQVPRLSANCVDKIWNRNIGGVVLVGKIIIPMLTCRPNPRLNSCRTRDIPCITHICSRYYVSFS